MGRSYPIVGDVALDPLRGAGLRPFARLLNALPRACQCPDCRPYHYESRVIMTRGIARLLAKMFGALVLLSAIIFIIVAFNERETASVLANSLWATLQAGHDIEASSPQPYVDYLAEAALRISFFTF